MKEKSDQISCPTCQKIVFKRGLFGHLRLEHDKKPQEAHDIMSSLYEKKPEKVEKLIEAQEEVKIQENFKVQEEIKEDPEQGGTSKLPAIAFIIGILGIATIFLRRIDPRFKEITDELINKLEDLGSKKSSESKNFPGFPSFPPPGKK